MSEQPEVLSSSSVEAPPLSARSIAAALRGRIRQQAHHLGIWLSDDWYGARRVPWALLVLLITSLAVASFYIDQPIRPEFSYDTPSYLAVTSKILTQGQPVDALRTPGYPMLVALVFLVAGVNNFLAVSVVQGILFVLATLEIYLLTLLVLRRAWLAGIIGLLVGSNTYLLSFVKPIIVEGFALWLTVSLALASVLFVQRLQRRYLWLAAVLTLLLFMTRPEWVYLPIPLMAFLLLVAARHGLFRRMVPHALGAVFVLYAFLGLFIYVNATQNGYAGISSVQNINLVGKILQYHMQDEAPPEYAQTTQALDAFVKRGGWNPYDLLTDYPPITENHWALGGAYAAAIIEHHPLEFLADSLVTFFTASNSNRAFSSFDASGPVAAPPLYIQETLSAGVVFLYRFFPLFALLWGMLFFWQRTKRLSAVEGMAAISFLVLYELATTTTGAYREYDYARIHIPFDPLMILVICGSLLAVLGLVKWPTLEASGFFRSLWRIWAGALLFGLLISVVVETIRKGPEALLHPSIWPLVSLLLTHTLWGLAAVLATLLFAFLADQARHRQRLAWLGRSEETAPLPTLAGQSVSSSIPGDRAQSA